MGEVYGVHTTTDGKIHYYDTETGEHVYDPTISCTKAVLPSADAVEVVRCKDCKYRDADDFCTGRGYPNVLVPDDGFCDKGERRE